MDLRAVLGPVEYAIGYAYFELQSIHQRETVLKAGSDDGIEVWLNGEEVLAVEAQRGHRLGEDEVPIFPRTGVNRFLIKVDHETSAWGFSVQVPKANF